MNHVACYFFDDYLKFIIYHLEFFTLYVYHHRICSGFGSAYLCS